MRSMLRAAFLSLIIGVVIFPVTASAALPPEVQNDREFMSWLMSLTDQVAQDRHYQRIPLDSEPQIDEFTVVLHELFRGETTEADFFSWVAGRYPGHEYETATIIRIMHAHWKAGKK